MQREVEYIIIDHYDSFTYNLVESLHKYHLTVRVFRPDVGFCAIAKVLETKAIQPILVLSPGPGTPQQATLSIQLVERYFNKLPILGICLGHQIIAHALGGTVQNSYPPCHGKAMQIKHNQKYLFQNLAQNIFVARYHSLCVTALPPNFEATSYYQSLIMSMQHKILPIFGLQFHPESILTPDGDTMLMNFIQYCTAYFENKAVQHV